ncbi:hypothetical protein D3C71_1904960 [compost metagenome]
MVLFMKSRLKKISNQFPPLHVGEDSQLEIFQNQENQSEEIERVYENYQLTENQTGKEKDDNLYTF